MINKSVLGSIALITFDAPKGNLLTLEDLRLLIEDLNSIEEEPSIEGIILKGNGRSFCAGLNNQSILDNLSELECDCFFKTFDHLLIKLFSYPKPIIAAINGHSIGGGLLIQCCADIRYGIENNNVKLGLPELKLGLTLDELMVSLVNFHLHSKNALSKILLNPDYLNIQEAKEMGFIDYIVPEDLLIEKCIEHLNILTSFNKKAFSVTKNSNRAKTKNEMLQQLNENCYKVFYSLLKAR